MSSHYGKYGCVYFDRGGPLQRVLGDFTLINIQLSLICQFGVMVLLFLGLTKVDFRLSFFLHCSLIPVCID